MLFSVSNFYVCLGFVYICIFLMKTSSFKQGDKFVQGVRQSFDVASIDQCQVRLTNGDISSVSFYAFAVFVRSWITLALRLNDIGATLHIFDRGNARNTVIAMGSITISKRASADIKLISASTLTLVRAPLANRQTMGWIIVYPCACTPAPKNSASHCLS